MAPQSRSLGEQLNESVRGIIGSDPDVYDANSRDFAIKTQQEMDTLLQDLKSGELSPSNYNATKRRYDELANQVKQFDPNRKDWNAQANRNAGTTGENALGSNLVNLQSQDLQQQITGRNQLGLATAADPLAQYQNDADLKRKMALNNQANLAQNVRDQLTQLGNARQSNATMINNAMGQGRQTFDR
jgi:hypothetical protein